MFGNREERDHFEELDVDGKYTRTDVQDVGRVIYVMSLAGLRSK
jgi:hypothetical protein